MGHRGGKNRNRNSSQNAQPYMFKSKGYGREYWQSDAYAKRLYNYYRNVMMQMAMTRFRWVGLPKTCNERYLEYTLLTQGVATIAFPRKMRGTFFSTQAVLSSPPNVYDDCTHWESFGNNGWRFDCGVDNGVLVYDNCTRMPVMDGIDLYATELVHIRQTKMINRFHQQIPWVLTGPQEKLYDMQQLAKQVAGGELAVLATDDLHGIKTTDVLQTGVPFLGEQLSQDEQQVWNRVYTMLGIENSPFKSERQTEDEVRAQKSPTTLVKMASLEERRRSVAKLNNRFGAYLEEDIKVVWRQDNESENWNLQRNMNSQLKLLKG